MKPKGTLGSSFLKGRTAGPYNIINFGFNPWSNYWKRNQTITYLLSKRENVRSVLYINTGKWLSNLVFDPAISLSNPGRHYWRFIIPKRVSAKITVFTPVYTPLEFKVRRFHRVLTKIRQQITSSFNNNPIILILNDPQADKDMLYKIARASKFIIFDWSDDFVEFSTNESEREICLETCRKYSQLADLVITVNDSLRDKAKKFSKNCYTLPNATNFLTFQPSQSSTKISRKIRSFGKKIVGYTGWLNSLRLDLDLIKYLVSNRPDVHFLFIGPKSERYPLGRDIPKMSNVHILRPIPYPDYPVCLSSMDVCILPNVISAHTRGNDPIKIYDYLASGRPIVSTRCAGTERFSRHLYLAHDKYEFLEFLDVALSKESEQKSVERQRIGLQHSWKKRINELMQIIAKTNPDLCL